MDVVLEWSDGYLFEWWRGVAKESSKVTMEDEEQ
jgi:hypothetical protein